MSDTARLYREMFDEGGRRVALRRAGLGDVIVRARVTAGDDIEVVGGVGSTVYKVIVLAEDVPATHRPLRQGDEIIVDGRTLIFIVRPDDQKRRDGELLLAYEGEAAGA